MNVVVELYYEFVAEHDVYLDRIAYDPDLRNPFLSKVFENTDFGPGDEAEILGHLFSLRKRGMLSRKRPR